MTIDQLSFGSHDLEATTAFYGGQLGFALLIHEWILLEEGYRLSTPASTAAEAAAWPSCSGSMCRVCRPTTTRAASGAWAYRLAPSISPFAATLSKPWNSGLTLLNTGVLVGELIDLPPYRSFFLDDPLNGQRLESTRRLGPSGELERDPHQRQLQANLNSFRLATIPGDAAGS